MEIDYNFIKSEEAKQIYVQLEKKRMLLEDYECGPNGRDYDLDNIFTFEDEEKKEMVERFLLRNEVISQSIADVEKYHIDWPDKRTRDVVTQSIGLKKTIDPEYIYETWLVESRKLKNECLFLEYNDEDPIKFLMEID